MRYFTDSKIYYLSVLLMLFMAQNGFSQIISFTDTNLENMLLTCSYCTQNLNGQYVNIDTNGDNQIQTTEADQILYLEVDDDTVSSLNDLSYFNNLDTLIIDRNSIINLNFDGVLDSLQTLSISRGDFYSILIKDLVSLEELGIDGICTTCLEINSLNLDNLTALRIMNLGRMDVQSFNHSGLTSLERATFHETGLTSLDLNQSPLLSYLSVWREPNMAVLDISFNSGLSELILEEVLLASLDLSNNSQLHKLVIQDCPIAALDLTTTPLLNDLALIDTQIQTVDASMLIQLEFLNLSDSTIPLTDFSPQYTSLKSLYLMDRNHVSFDVGSFPALETLILSSNDLTMLTGTNQSIKKLVLSYNDFSSFDGSQTPNIEELSVDYNSQLSTVDLTFNPSLQKLRCGNTQLTVLDLSENPEIDELSAVLTTLEKLNLKNGAIIDPHSVYVNPNSNALHICVDDSEVADFQQRYSNLTINSYCSFTPGGSFNEVQGMVTMDSDNNGCSSSDPAFGNFLFAVSNGSNNGLLSTDTSGSYYLPVEDGQHTITPQPENPSYWNFSPSGLSVDFPAQASPQNADFCITPNGNIEDLEITVVPIEQARPGFDTDYKVVVKNKGNQISNGSLTLDYEEDFMTLLSSNPAAGTPSSNQLSWSFNNLQPFQMETYLFSMTLNTPTAPVNPLNGGDVISFTGVVNGQGTDVMPSDNTFVLDQTVVNSFDPNDKTCLEGESIEPSEVGEYVHYMIRFENTGTASAVNVVIKDEIDTTKFDMSTLVPLGGSHDHYVRTVADNVVEFVHEDIFLDFNDATNDGHVLFKIKTLPTLVEGDTFDNDAEIYFDFNAPIITNNESTAVMTTASTSHVADHSIAVYPNPAQDILNVSSDGSIHSVAIIDINGRTLSQTSFTGSASTRQVELGSLASGVYFVRISTALGSDVKRVVKK